jgi:azurin
MKNQLLITLTALSFALLSACNKAPDAGSGAGGSETKTNAPARQAEAPDPNLPEVKVTINANDQMKFDVTKIEAKPGQKVTVTLKNAGTMPKVSMGHNFVLLTPDVDLAKFMEAGVPHMGRDYIAPEMESKVIAHTKLLGPNETDTISFAAPRKAGDYTFICSFPGHYAIGMKGTLTVQ